jgi:hypothetical protein
LGATGLDECDVVAELESKQFCSAFSCYFESTEMGHVEQTCVISGGGMFGQHALVLDGHHPTAEVGESSTSGFMSCV